MLDDTQNWSEYEHWVLKKLEALSCKSLPAGSVPVEAGYYWQRDSKHSWRIIEVKNLGEKDDPYLQYNAVDGNFYGRSFQSWGRNFTEIGEWQKIIPPNV